jgi:poly-gamma-glutamate synthesis protein (capsule biosynthesis protein)
VTHAGVANNHAGDFGPAGLARTRALLAAENVTAVDEAEAQVIRTADGRRIGVLALTERRPPAEVIAAARAESDLLIAFVHWGEENSSRVTDEQRELARWLIDHGVDLIAGSHPHRLQPVDYYRGCPIIYSLGNLVFDGAPNVREWNEGALAQIALTRNRGAHVRLLPVQLDTRGFPHPPSSLATAGAARSRKRVIGLSKNR